MDRQTRASLKRELKQVDQDLQHAVVRGDAEAVAQHEPALLKFSNY